MSEMTYAIVVGIDHYQKPLFGAVNDAQAFANWLRESGEIQEDASVASDPMRTRLKLITSTDLPGQTSPTKTEIDTAVGEVFTAVRLLPEKRAKRLYFYFAGHGLGLTYTNTALCMKPWNRFLNTFCLSATDYLNGFLQLNVFDEVILLLDCCRDTDVLAKGDGPGWNMFGTDATKVDYIVGHATRYSKRSQEIEVVDAVDSVSKKRGAFTTFLLEALKGDAARANGEIYSSDLIRHMQENFPSFTARLRYTQEPEFPHNLGTRDILIHRIATSSPFNVVITFTKPATVTLCDGALNEIRKGAVVADEKWELNLDRGTFTLTSDTEPQNEIHFKNFNAKTVTNVKF